jgi:hypothetical protein
MPAFVPKNDSSLSSPHLSRRRFMQRFFSAILLLALLPTFASLPTQAAPGGPSADGFGGSDHLHDGIPPQGLVTAAWRAQNAPGQADVERQALQSPATLSRRDLARSALNEADTTRSYKDPQQALWLSGGGTVVPVGIGALILSADSGSGVGLTLLAVGGILGPSLGHVYAEDWGQAIIGTLVRTALGIVTLAGLVVAAFTSSSDGSAAFVLGGLAFIASGVFDIVTAPDSAQDYNEEHGLSAQVRPTYDPVTDGTGLTVRVQF